MTDEQIIELAKTCGYSVNIKTNQWECWEEQLIEFSKKVAEVAYEQGRKDLWNDYMTHNLYKRNL